MVAPGALAEMLGQAGAMPGADPLGTPPPTEPSAQALPAAPSMDDPESFDMVAEEQPADERVYKDPTAGQAPILDEVWDSEKGSLDQLGERLTALFKRFETARQATAEPGWELSEKLYDGIVDGSSFPYGALYEIREVFRQVEASRALTITGLFGQRRRFKYLPLQPEGEDIANRATAAVRQQLKEFRLNNQMIRWLKMPAKVGISYIYEGWATYKRIKRKLSQLHDVDGTVMERLCEEVAHGGPMVEWLDHWKVFFWPWIEEVENQRCGFVRELVDGEYLRTMVREGEFDKDQVEKALDTEANGVDKNDFRRGEWNSNNIEETGDKEYELTTCWTSTGWVYAKVGCTVVQGKRNGFERIPIRALKYYAREGEHYGHSEPQILAAEQILLRDTASMWVDSIHYNLQPMWIANNALKNTFKNSTFRPGGVIWVDGKPDEQIRALPTTQTPFDLGRVMETIRRYMQNDSSITDEITGLGSRQRTASGMIQLQQAASLRHKLKIIEWQEDIEQVYLDIYEMNRMFQNGDIFARVESVGGEEMPGSYGPEIFDQEVEVELNMPDATEPPGLRQQRILPFLQMAQQDPRFNFPYLVEQAGLAFEFPNPRKLLMDPGRSRTEAFQDIEDFVRYGILPEPLPTDNHQERLQIYAMFAQTPRYAALDDSMKVQFERNVRMHEDYMSQMMAMGGGGGGIPEASEPQYPVSEQSNERTEAMFQNGQTGAQQQGRMMK